MKRLPVVRVMTILLMGWAIFSYADAASDAKRKEEMLSFFDSMQNIYRTYYAPGAWKKQHLGWDLDSSIQEAKKKIRASTGAPSVAAFQKILYDFIGSMKDYHVSVAFHSTESASLPFSVLGAGDRYFIAYIDRNALGKTAFPFNVGDELVTFGDRPIKEVMNDLQSVRVANVPETDRMLTAIALTDRKRAKGYFEIPHGPIRIGVIPKGAKKTSYQQLIWKYTPEKVIALGAPNHLASNAASCLFSPGGPVCSVEDSPRIREKVKMDVDSVPASPENPCGMGARKSYVPELGKKIWESDEKSHFHAYLFQAADRHLVGYIRVPTFGGSAKDVKEFGEVIERFEKNADALVIDQINNPGGAVYFTYALVSMLADQAFSTPRHRIALTQSTVADAAQTLEKIQDVETEEDAAKIADQFGGYPVSLQVIQFTRAFAQFIIDEWQAERTLTNPYFLEGIDQINPNPTAKFTKPILLLTNHLDFSGGDFFPAILQDNNRVTILGSRTAGAGGAVMDISIPNDLGVEKVRDTYTIAERMKTTPQATHDHIENLGVKPDIEYELTVEDLQNSFSGYAKAIQEALAKMLK